MPPPVQVTLRLNRNQLSDGLRRLSIVSDKLPSLLINKATFSIANRARKAMPVVQPNRIREELEEFKVHELVTLKSGKFSRNKKNIRSHFGQGDGSVPLLALIIQSRVNGGGFWKIPHSPFKGVSRSEGAVRMLEAMRKVFNARIRSTGYFRVSADVIKFIFGRASGVMNAFGGGSISNRIGKIAGGTPATGKGRAVARWWVSATRPDTEGSKQAIFKIAEPVWQRAMDEEGKSILRRTVEKEYAEAIKLAGFKVV